MIVLPVIARELRSAARHSYTYHLRTIGVAAMLLVSGLFGLEHGFSPSSGSMLFVYLHRTLHFAIWVLVPILTSDCISRERREGTLGLLFLTSLRGTDIVVAKSAAHGLRALTLGVAILPVLTIPFLLGGVTWQEALASVLINFSAACWALSAGLIASAWNMISNRSLLQAVVLSAGFFLLLGFVVGCWVILPMLSGGRRAWFFGPNALAQFQTSGAFVLSAGLSFMIGAGRSWAGYFRIGGTGKPLLEAMAQIALLSLLALGVATWIGGRKIRGSWQQEIRSMRQVWLEKVFCTPILWLSFFRRWMRNKLEKNPIGWLEQRTWSGRLVIWGWLAVLASVYSVILRDQTFYRATNAIEGILSTLLAGSMALSAAGSFRRERDSGILELLLVSPLAETEIIQGRLRGLWSQFFPAFALLLGSWAYIGSFSISNSNFESIFFYGITFLTIPVIGLYFSLKCRLFITSFLATVAVGILIPISLPILLLLLQVDSNSGMGASAAGALLQLLSAGWCWHLMVERLRKRNFPLEKLD